MPASEALLRRGFAPASVGPYAARAPWPVSSLKSTSLARDAAFELREWLEPELGGRMTQPEGLDLVIAFAVAHRSALVLEVRARREGVGG